MKQKIKKNLTNLFNENYQKIAKVSFSHMIDENIEETNNGYKSKGIYNYLEDQEAINLIKLKENRKLHASFIKAQSLDIDEQKIITGFIHDIKKSIEKIKIKLKESKQNFSNQIIFLGYDHLPEAWFSGYGKGNYPILDKPEYFEFNFSEEMYVGIGKIDYSNVWSNLISLNEQLEDLDVFDALATTDTYNYLLNSYLFKTYLLLFKAFDNIMIEEFEGINIEKPLFIYGNEHDCEPMNIYIYN